MKRVKTLTIPRTVRFIQADSFSGWGGSPRYTVFKGTQKEWQSHVDNNVIAIGTSIRQYSGVSLYKYVTGSGTDAELEEFETDENDYTDVPKSWWSNTVVSTVTNIGLLNGDPDELQTE